MNEREAFLNRLAENEDDITTRLVFADWLDEQGEHEEADRQRKWPPAKEWLVQFCQKENSRYEAITYEALLEFGREVVKEENASQRVYLDNEDLWDALKAHSQDFWKNWAVVTGVPLPPSLETKGFHTWQCCSHEVYYWFGDPDSDEPEATEPAE